MSETQVKGKRPAHADHRRKAALKRDIEALREQNGALGVIVASIRTSSEAEVADIVQQIRADEDLETIAESLKRNVTLLGRSDTNSAEADLSNLIGNPSLDESGVVKHFGLTSNLSLVSEDDRSPLHPQTSEAWTTVTRDPIFVEHLMALYFSWSHPFYVLFSQELFLHDMANGGSKYCSPLLVNALLAVACAFSDRPEARSNPHDPLTAGDHFFAEAKRLLQSNDSSNLTTVQALALMGLREASCSRDSSGFQYAGRCIRMAIELGLHLSFGANSNKLGPTELEVRKITFWGCFTYDTAWSICIGRISQLPRTAINLDMPNVLGQLDFKPWRPYTDYGIGDMPDAEQPSYTHTLLYQFSLLSEIVNDTVFMFYAPRERFTSKKLLDFYNRYTRWFTNLPETLHLRAIPMPHVLTLHMYYHTVILHLFRPFLKVDLTNSKISPREVCTSCANTVSTLLSTYRQHYGFRRSTVLVSHIILSSIIIDLLNLPDPTAARNLELGMTSLRESSLNHAFTFRCLQIVLALSKQWNIQLPAGVSQAAYELPQEWLMNGLHDVGAATVWPPTPSSAATYSHPQDHRRSSVAEKAYYTTSNSPRGLSQAPQPMDMFWSPFPDHSVPLQAMQPNGPMDISAMIDVQNSGWDQLNRDGFKMANFNDTVLAPSGYIPNGQWPHG
ncbi:MAG: hypothetical protein Q9217_003706 [Psora testacea]